MQVVSRWRSGLVALSLLAVISSCTSSKSLADSRPKASSGDGWWTATPDTEDSGTIFFGEGVVVVVGSLRGAAINEHTGSRLWETEELTDDGAGWAEVRASTVAYWSEDHRDDGLLLDRHTGALVGMTGTPIPARVVRPTAASTRGWTIDNSDRVVTVVTPAGAKWQRSVRWEFTRSPVLVDRSWVVWGSADGVLQGFDVSKPAAEQSLAKLGFHPA